MEEALVAKLLATSSITNLVSDRINWMDRQQGVPDLPALVLTRISQIGQVTNEGPDGLDETTIQFDCLGESFASALSLSRAVKSALVGAKFLQSSVRFQGVFHESERDSFEDLGERSPQRIYRVSVDLRLWHDNVA